MAPKKYGKVAHDPIPEDETPLLDKYGHTHIQNVVGIILWYACAVYLMVLMALSTIATEQFQATNTRIKNVKQLLDYLATNPNSTMRYYALNMIFNIHYDALYLSESNSKSRASRTFSLEGLPATADLSRSMAQLTHCAPFSIPWNCPRQRQRQDSERSSSM